MGKRNIHVGGSHRRCHGLEAIGYGHNHVRLQIVENRCEFRQAEPGGLGRGYEIFSLEDHVNLPVYLEARFFDNANRTAIAFQQRRCRDDELQLNILMRAQRLKGGVNPRVAGTRGNDHAYFSSQSVTFRNLLPQTAYPVARFWQAFAQSSS